MILRNSFHSLIRSGGKTALFTLLIFALTLALALSVSVWASVAQFLANCDAYYTTIGLFEYMGTSYPDDTVYDVAMEEALTGFDTSVITNDEATLLWDAPARSLGSVEGFWRSDTIVPSRILSVLVVGNVYYDENNKAYNATVLDALYSQKSEDNTIILIDQDFATFEQGNVYMVFGEVYRVRSPMLHLRKAAYNNAIANKQGIEIPRIVDITSDSTDGPSYEIPADSVLLKVADTLAVTNNSALVVETDNLMALLPFHQQELYIIAGRVFTEDEYANGSRVALISELMADRLGVGIGDTINLSTAISNQPGIYNSYWVTDGFSYNDIFTVVGIFNTVMDKSWYVYVPRSADIPESPYPVGYTVGQAILRNEDAAAFSARMEEVLGERFQLTIYDQGYSTVAKPYQTILSIAKIVTGVCALVELAVLILFGFLFVYRQRETSETMLMLGAGKAHVCKYFLSSAGFIALIATTTGAAAGYWLHGGIIAWVTKAAQHYTLIDSRFSNGKLTIARTLEFAPELTWQLFLSVGIAVFLFSILACAAFAVSTFFHNRPSRQNSWGPNKEQRTSHLSGGSLKFALLSIMRGGARTLVVPILAVSIMIFFGQLASTTVRYQEQLDAIYDNTTIKGYYTDINGKQIGNQVLNAYDVGNLYHTGLVNNLSVSLSEPYYYLGVSQRAVSGDQNISPLYVPSSSYAYESMVDTILRGSDLTMTNDFRTSPAFYYAETILMNFMDGYDESILAAPAGDEKAFSCIIPSSLMAEKGIAFGDTIRVAINRVTTDTEDNARIFHHFDLRVVGSYEKQGTQDEIYAPLSLFFDTGLIWSEDQPAAGAPANTFDTGYTLTPEQEDALQNTVFHSASFTLTDSRSLAELKNYLTEYGYSEVHNVSKVRQFVVLKDAIFNNGVASIKQQIRYINMLYPFLYLLVGIIAVVVSYLLIVGRKKEFATIRGLGGTRVGAFSSFFLEQSMLCLLGTSIGLACWWLLAGQPTDLQLLLTAGFLGCYFFGCAVSAIIMNHTNVLTILLDKD